MYFPKKQRLIGNFSFLITIQVLSSTFLILPLFIGIKYLPEFNKEVIAYFSFATNLVIGFTKSVLVTSHSLKKNKEIVKHKSVYNSTEINIIIVLIVFQTISAYLILNLSLISTIYLHIGFVAMVFVEYECQKMTIAQIKWRALWPYLCLILTFIGLTSFSTIFHQLNPQTLINYWATSAIITSLAIKILYYGEITIDLRRNKSKNRNLFAIDFLINYGLLQVLYSFGTLITSVDEMLKYRMIMFLSIPTNVIMQIMSTSGLGIIFKENSKARMRLMLYFGLTLAPIILFTVAFWISDSQAIAAKFGVLWNQIPDLILPFFVMSISAIILSGTSMKIKWENLTEVVFFTRILVCIIQVPITYFFIQSYGAAGILYSLSIFNFVFIAINIRGLQKPDQN